MARAVFGQSVFRPARWWYVGRCFKYVQAEHITPHVFPLFSTSAVKKSSLSPASRLCTRMRTNPGRRISLPCSSATWYWNSLHFFTPGRRHFISGSYSARSVR